MNTLDEIKRYLESWLVRYRMLRALRWSGRGLLAGLILCAIAATWIVPQTYLLLEQFIYLALGLAAAGLVLAGLAGRFWPVNQANAMRYFDRTFNLRERISTAIEFSQLDRSENSLLAAQQQDALEQARQVDLRFSLPLRLPWPEIGVALMLVILVAGLTIRNQPAFLAAMQKHNLTKRIQEQAANLEEIQLNIQKLEHLTPDQRAAIAEPLEESARKLESAQTLEEAISALHEAEQALRVLSPAELQKQAAGLKETGQTAAAQTGNPLEAFGQPLAEGDFSEAAEALEALDPAAMNAEQRDNLADSLQAAASALQNSSPGLSQNLQNAAEHLQSGDSNGAEQALSQASQQLASQAGNLAVASAASQAAAQLSASQQSLAQAGSPANTQANANSQAGSGQNNGSQNAGQGSVNSPGSTGGDDSGGNNDGGGSSAGAGQGESQGGEVNDGQAGSQPIGTANQPGDGGEREFESVYAPQRLNSDTGQAVQLPGSGQEGQVIGEAGQSPGVAPNQSLIPYSEVFPAYETVVRQAIESGQVPLHLRALVRDYFSSLAP